jgi:acyl-coenzyme A thioesterase PaaI-like protein
MDDGQGFFLYFLDMELTPRSFRILMNLYPPYLFSRTRVKFVSLDWKEVVVELKKSLLTRNYVGTTFGGSLYQAADPFFMLMLIKIMGIKDYIIWDQDAEVVFTKPARSKVTYHFKITDEQLGQIRKDLEQNPIVRPQFYVDGVDDEGETCIRIRKGLYIRKKIKK